ncbi:MAG: hypothetical protein Q9198_004139 [Flavoplaca austrocitrina]
MRKLHLASLREEFSRAFVHGISPFQSTSRFAENVIGPRLRAKHSEREEDADQYHDGLAQDALDKVAGASNRLNSVLNNGPPIESSKTTDTWPAGAYQGSLCGIYTLNLQTYEYPHQPQLVTSSYAQNATASQSSASRDDGNLGRLVRRPRTQALQNHATTTRSAEAPITQSHQTTPSLGVQPLTIPLIQQGSMPPPTRPTDARLPHHLQPARVDPTTLEVVTENTSPLPSSKAEEIPAATMLLKGLNTIMVSSYAREQAPGIQYEFASTQVGGDPEPTRESLVSDKATGDGDRGGSRPADPSMSTESTHDAESTNQLQDRSTAVQTVTWAIASKASRKNAKERGWTEHLENDDAGTHTRETKT